MIVTGRPGAGKSTLAPLLGDALGMPVVSRDKIKEGYCRTRGKGHADLPREANGTINDIFANVLASLIDGGVSAIAEAAFQHRVWAPLLAPFAERARIRIIICATDDATAYNRYIARSRADPRHAYYHGFAYAAPAESPKPHSCRGGILPPESSYSAPVDGVIAPLPPPESSNGVLAPPLPPYDEPRVHAPTFRVDTTGAYSPSISELCMMVMQAL